jgi:hypothetical protein
MDQFGFPCIFWNDVLVKLHPIFNEGELTTKLPIPFPALTQSTITIKNGLTITGITEAKNGPYQSNGKKP